jgi:hypothetical protein
VKLTENDLQQIYQQMTARPALSADCLDEEMLMRAASADISEDERTRIVAHVKRCSDCAREYRIVREMRAFERIAENELGSSRSWLRTAVAAAIAMIIPALAALIVIQYQHDGRIIERLQRELSLQRIHQEPPHVVAIPTRPQVGVPIVDLDADVTREVAASEAPLIDVPPTAESFALILHLPEPPGRQTITADLLDSRGASLWHGPVTADGTSITVGLDNRIAPTGSYALRVNQPGRPVTFRFRVKYR